MIKERKNKQTKEDMKAEKKDKYQKAVEALKSAQFPNPGFTPCTPCHCLHQPDSVQVS